MIGEEAKAQILEAEGRLPDAVVACVGGGSNAIGMFATFIEEEGVRLIGVEPAGHGIESGKHGAPIGHAPKGIYLGMVSYLMQDKDGQVVVIKPTSEASYKNLVDALDEMQICSIAKYAIVDMTEGDQFLLENLKSKGAYGASAAPPKN